MASMVAQLSELGERMDRVGELDRQINEDLKEDREQIRKLDDEHQMLSKVSLHLAVWFSQQLTHRWMV
jgi:hypothetical protein